MKQINCDYCQHHFALQPQAELTAVGETQYFVCPYCQHRYDVCLITPKGLQLRNELHQMEQATKHMTPRLRKTLERKRAAYHAEIQSLLSPMSHPV